MTQYWCGHHGHSAEDRPNLTVLVCSAIGAPAIFVGDMDTDRSGTLISAGSEQSSPSTTSRTDASTQTGGASGSADGSSEATAAGLFQKYVPNGIPMAMLADAPRPADAAARSLRAGRRGEDPGPRYCGPGSDFWPDTSLDTYFEATLLEDPLNALIVTMDADDAVDLRRSLNGRPPQLPRPDPQLAVTGEAGPGQTAVACTRTAAEPYIWPSRILDWITLVAIVAALTYLASRLLEKQTGTWHPIVWIGIAVALIGGAAYVAKTLADSAKLKAAESRWRVLVNCPVQVGGQSHKTVFSQPSGGEETVFGAPATDADSATTAAHSKYRSPDDAADRVNKQARLIFTGQALFVLFLGGVVWRVTTGDEGAATGIDRIEDLVRNNATEFSLAIAALAASFAFAVLAQTSGFAGSTNLLDQGSTSTEINRALSIRTSLAQNGAALLGVSLLLAVAVPTTSALNASTGLEIAAPTWTSQQDVWQGTSTITLTNPTRTDDVQVGAWVIGNGIATPITSATEQRPVTTTDEGASRTLSIPLRFNAQPGATIAIVAALETNVGSAPMSGCSDAPSEASCATFALPTATPIPPAVSGAWTANADGTQTLALALAASQMGPGVVVPVRVTTHLADAATATEVHAVTLTSDASGAISWQHGLTLDPRRERTATVTLNGSDCSTPRDCFKFTAPVPADVTVPIITLTGTQGPISGTVSVPVMPIGEKLSLFVYGGDAGSERILYGTVVGGANTVGRTISFEIPLMQPIEWLVVDARVSADPPAGFDTSCTETSITTGCIVMRVD